jgi:hypothetical protein
VSCATDRVDERLIVNDTDVISQDIALELTEAFQLHEDVHSFMWALSNKTIQESDVQCAECDWRIAMNHPSSYTCMETHLGHHRAVQNSSICRLCMVIFATHELYKEQYSLHLKAVRKATGQLHVHRTAPSTFAIGIRGITVVLHQEPLRLRAIDAIGCVECCCESCVAVLARARALGTGIQQHAL